MSEKEYYIQSGIAFLNDLLAEDSFSSAAFENNTFVIRPCCWCDGEDEDHADGCPPEFEHKKSDFSASWYKHVNRGFEADEVSKENFIDLMIECLQSLKGGKS